MSTVATKHLGVAADFEYAAREDHGQCTTTHRYTRKQLVSKVLLQCALAADFKLRADQRIAKMTWYIHRGEDMQRDQRIVLPFYRSLPHNPPASELIFTDELLECSLAQAPKYPQKGVTAVNCKLTADLTGVSKHHFARMVGVDGTPYVAVSYDLVVSMKTAVMKFSLEIGGEEMGSVEASYD
ncbi:MAG: hypothetical protein Q9212_006175 [Teloschistes hypoglaucus]